MDQSSNYAIVEGKLCVLQLVLLNKLGEIETSSLRSNQCHIVRTSDGNAADIYKKSS
jgi:hypothetical protein